MEQRQKRKRRPSYCVVYGCSTRSVYYDQASLHTFPSERKRLEQWIKFVKKTKKDWVISNSSRICSKHFESHCFPLKYKIQESMGMRSGNEQKRTLNKDAIPTIYPNQNPCKKKCRPLNKVQRMKNLEEILSMHEKMEPMFVKKEKEDARQPAIIPVSWNKTVKTGEGAFQLKQEKVDSGMPEEANSQAAGHQGVPDHIEARLVKTADGKYYLRYGQQGKEDSQEPQEANGQYHQTVHEQLKARLIKTGEGTYQLRYVHQESEESEIPEKANISAACAQTAHEPFELESSEEENFELDDTKEGDDDFEIIEETNAQGSSAQATYEHIETLLITTDEGTFELQVNKKKDEAELPQGGETSSRL